MVTIALSPNQDAAHGRDSMPPDYVKAVLRAGALPVILPTLPEGTPRYDELIGEILSRVDGVVLVGGPDIDPLLYGEAQLPVCHAPVPARDKADLALFRMALKLRKPVLAICRGIQVMNAELGGTLYQDIPSQTDSKVVHETGDPQAHEVRVAKGTLLHSILGTGSLTVSSRHHQAVRALAPGLVSSAAGDDGIVEAAEFADGCPALGVQWHPETTAAYDTRQQALFDWLVLQAGAKP